LFEDNETRLFVSQTKINITENEEKIKLIKKKNQKENKIKNPYTGP